MEMSKKSKHWGSCEGVDSRVCELEESTEDSNGFVCLGCLFVILDQ